MKEVNLENYIIVNFPNSENPSELYMTSRENFETLDLCDCYQNHGSKVFCQDAGCYSLDNSYSEAASQVKDEIEAKFKIGFCIDIENVAGDFKVFSLDEEKELTETQETEINAFIKEWRTNNENHTTVKGWTYHDSHNFKTFVLSADDSTIEDVHELTEKEQNAILSEYPGVPHIEGTNVSEETENYIFNFDRWATNPWICKIEKK